MDLSFARFERDLRAPPMVRPLDLLLAAAASRQATTPTARLAARLSTGALDRVHGAFERETAQMLLARQQE